MSIVNREGERGLMQDTGKWRIPSEIRRINMGVQENASVDQVAITPAVKMEAALKTAPAT